MPRPLENIVIQEPPIQELGKRHSCFRRSCASGFGCLFLILFASLITLKLAVGPKQHQLKTVPAKASSLIEIYDPSNIHRVIFVPDERERPRLSKAAVIPKVILSPVLFALEHTGARNRWFTMELRDLIASPSHNGYDMLTIEWTNLTASGRFIREFYIDDIKKRGYAIGTDTPTSILFSDMKKDIQGQLMIEDDDETEQTDLVTLLLIMPKK